MMRAVLPSEKGEEPAQKKREEKIRSVKQEHTADRVPLFLRCLSKIGHPCCRKEVNNVFPDRSNIVTIQGPNGPGAKARCPPYADKRVREKKVCVKRWPFCRRGVHPLSPVRNFLDSTP